MKLMNVETCEKHPYQVGAIFIIIIILQEWKRGSEG